MLLRKEIINKTSRNESVKSRIASTESFMVCYNYPIEVLLREHQHTANGPQNFLSLILWCAEVAQE